MIRGLILQKKYQIYPAIQAVAFVGFFPALIIFHRIFWIFLQDKIRKISQCKTVILISNRTFLWKIVGNVLERCTNRSTFKSYMQFLNVIIQMQVALVLMAYLIELAFENLLVLISAKLHSKRLITHTNCCNNYFNEVHLEWMKRLCA